MEFTREPIIETVITPKEGCKLVVRSSKSAGQEEFFVDAVEVVSFGNALFFRSIERPKAFIVPASDYEILEVREARMVLKNVGIERTIKIGGGKVQREAAAYEKEEPAPQPEVAVPVAAEASETKAEARVEKKRERRRHSRRRRGREEGAPEEEGELAETQEKAAPAPVEEAAKEDALAEKGGASPYKSSLLLPPSTLISETIAKYRDNAVFQGAFYVKEELKPEDEKAEVQKSDEPAEHPEDLMEAMDMRSVSLEPSEFGTFGLIEEEQEMPPLPEEEGK